MRIRCIRSVFLVVIVAVVAVPSRAQNPLDKLRNKVNKGIHDATSSTPTNTSAPPPRVRPPTSAPQPGHPPQPGQPGAAPGVPLSANIKETLLGPRQPGQIFVSDDGGHTAIAALHGSREIMVVDGAEGPEFDQVGHASLSAMMMDVVFSPDGRHLAYLGRRGNDLIVVADGKESGAVAILPNGGVAPITPTDPQHPGHQFLYSRSGSHLAYVTSINAPGVGGNVWNMYLDGVKSPPYLRIDPKQVFFSGERLVFAAQTADQKWHVVVNDKPGSAYDSVQSLEVNANHFAYLAGDLVVADGVASAPHPSAHDLVLATDGRTASFGRLKPSVNSANTVEPMYVGDKQIATDWYPFNVPNDNGTAVGTVDIKKITFSPDGKRFAYTKKSSTGGVAAVIDGKPELEYGSIDYLQYSPDSKRYAYVGHKGVLSFVVIDGQEMPAQNSVKHLTFSADSSRFGYEAFKDGQFTVVVDGKESPKFRELKDRSLIFSPDGKRYAYAACLGILQCQVTVDGETTNIPIFGAFQTRMMRPQIFFPVVFFSPDSSRAVYVMGKSDGTGQQAVVMNGKEISTSTSFSFPSFSMDGKHFGVVGWTGKGWSVLVDGKVGPTYEDIIEVNPQVVRFEDAHTLRFLGIKGGSVYRVLVDVGS